MTAVLCIAIILTVLWLKNEQAKDAAEQERQRIEQEAEQKRQRQEEFQARINPEMISVDGGTFTMGCTSEQGRDCKKNEKPAHLVRLSSFSISKYEITQSQWKAIMGNNPSFFQRDDFPVTNVSWDDVQDYISKLNGQTGRNYRLPTEAEWEYAARGGNLSNGYKYSGSNDINDIAWYYNNINAIHSVGGKQPNELGIYDMTGNVTELCSDWYGDDYYSWSPRTDPKGPASGGQRVIRGGGWNSIPDRSRVSFRNSISPGNNSFSEVGFRLVQDKN